MALPINIQMFAESGEGNTEPNANGGNNAQEGGDTSKTYTQEELDNIVDDERKARLKADLNAAATLEALKQNISVECIPHVLKLFDKDGCIDSDGKIVGDKLSEAIKKVLDDVPAFKGAAESSGGVHRVGGDGNGGEQRQGTQKTVPAKKWNRFNL